MIEDLHIELIQMMENAGRNLADLTLRLVEPAASVTAAPTAVVVAGRGGNGGGGLVAARHLINRGVDVTVVLTRPGGRFGGVPGHQLDIVERLGSTLIEPPFEHGLAAALAEADVVVDAAIGYSLGGAPSGPAAEAIVAVNAASGPVVALDTPSGLDTATGATPGVVVEADATLTLAAPKRGLRDASVVGRLFVGDISVPPAVIERLGHAAPDFARSPILAISA